MANLNELLLGLGYAKQADIKTVAGTKLWRLPNWNKKPISKRPVNEDDRTEIGKGHEFPTQPFPSHYENPLYQIERPASSELMAFLGAFGLGKVTLTGAAPPYIYTCVPLNPPTDGLEPPYFSIVQQMRPGAASVLDEVYIGCAVAEWGLSVKKSPGRESAMLTASIATSGLYTAPSLLAVPASVPWHEMYSPTMTVNINGVDYAANKRFESLEFRWRQNLRPGFFPGSGTQDGYAVQGRLEVGDRECAFSYVARLEHGSTEAATLLALTSGTAVIGLSNGPNDSATLTLEKMPFQVVELADAAGIVTVQVTALPEYDATNGVVSLVVNSSVGGICQAAA
jgi:hypothetical protein